MRPRLALLGPLLLAGLSLPAVAASSSYAADVTCQGLPATIVSDAATITGTDGDDVISSVSPTTPSRVNGLGGNDTICLLAGDSVDSGAGDDSVVVTSAASRPAGTTSAALGPGTDSYTGSDGADLVTLRGSSGVQVDLGPGDDEVVMSEPAAGATGMIDLGSGRHQAITVRVSTRVVLDLAEERLVTGTSEKSRFTVRGADDANVYSADLAVDGNRHANAVFAYGCRIRVEGGAGPDVIKASGGFRDRSARLCRHSPLRTTWRESGARLAGQQGADVLTGGRQDDVLVGGPGRDRADGARGRDTCSAEVEKSC